MLGKCHPSYERLLPWWSDRFPEPRELGHTKQLYGHWVEVTSHRVIFNRSIFGMIDVYNNLPQQVIDATSVSDFQHQLMHVARTRCQLGDAEWASSFSRRAAADDA